MTKLTKNGVTGKVRYLKFIYLQIHIKCSNLWRNSVTNQILYLQIGIMCLNFLRNSLINQLVYLQIKHYARKLIEKLPADKCNERNILRNNMLNILLYLQINTVCANLLIKPQINYFNCT